MKKIFSTVAVAAMTMPVAVMASSGFSVPSTSETGLSSTSIYTIVKTIMQWLLGLVGIVGVIGFAIAGILYLVAAGDETRIDQAKNAMMYSIIGIVVALVGLIVVNAIASMLGGSSTTF